MSSQMVSFKDQNSAYEYRIESMPDSTFSAAENNVADLGNFLERPLKIADFVWSTSVDNFYQDFDPWTLFMQNPRVINRITNFNNLRCKLHLRFLINGNGFHYGRLLVNYKPRVTSDQFIVDRALAPFREFDNVEASQRPHLYLDPTTSQGGDMVLPFFFPMNYLNIPDQNWSDMGNISIRTLQNLRHANGASDISRISVFAWCEDVSLAVPTSAEPGALTPQSGEERYVPQAGDEYGTGPISRPASVVSRIAGMLSAAPYIGAYARATQIATGALAQVAVMFGFSRPNVISDIEGYKPYVMGNMSNTNMPDTCVKLSVDAKQELTVDPSTVGLAPTDEMTICSIACRETYLTSFPWSPDPLVHTAESGLFRVDVTPGLTANITPVGGPTETHMTACGFAAFPFEQWKGTMRFRFQIVASNYHKGRLKFVWDPHAFLSNEYNTNYTHIIDIAEEKDFTMELGWGNHRPYLDTPPDYTSNKFANNTDLTSPDQNRNGVLHVYVVNDLTLPSAAASTEPININVFVSAGDDMMLRNPKESLDLIRYFAPQSGEESLVEMDKEDTEEPSKPMQEQTEILMMDKQQDDDPYDHVFFGESIVSFRNLLKRYNRHSHVVYPFVGGAKLYRHNWNSFPFYRGFAPGAVTPVTGGGNFNFSHTTLMNYLTPAYAGWRGSIRWKVNNYTQGEIPRSYGAITISRSSNTPDPYSVVTNALPIGVGAENDITRILNNNMKEGTAGCVSTNDQINPCLEVDMPYQSVTRFSNARKANLTSGDFALEAPKDLFIEQISRGADTALTISEKFVAAGEDFSLFFYIGPPICYITNINPDT